MMKRIITVAFSIATLICVSCNKENQGGDPNPQPAPSQPEAAKLFYNDIELDESVPFLMEVGEEVTFEYEGPQGEELSYSESQDVLDIDWDELTIKALKEGECKVTLQEKEYTIKVNPELGLTVDESAALAGSKVKLSCTWPDLEWTIQEPDALVMGKAEFMDMSADKKTTDLALPLYVTKDLRDAKPLNGRMIVTVKAPYGKSKSVEVTSNGWEVIIANYTNKDWNHESVAVGDVILVYLSDVDNHVMKNSVFSGMPLQIFYTGSAYTYTTLPEPFQSVSDSMLALQVQSGESDYSLAIKSVETKQIIFKLNCKLTSGN